MATAPWSASQYLHIEGEQNAFTLTAGETEQQAVDRFQTTHNKHIGIYHMRQYWKNTANGAVMWNNPTEVAVPAQPQHVVKLTPPSQTSLFMAGAAASTEKQKTKLALSEATRKAKSHAQASVTTSPTAQPKETQKEEREDTERACTARACTATCPADDLQEDLSS
jgi:flagellar biosynthesis GTPase FlhF